MKIALLALVLVSTAGDAEALQEVLGLAARGPDEGLRAHLENAASKIQDAGLRKKTIEALDEVVAAATVHHRTSRLVAEVKELGGKTTLEAGGPAWMREAAGDGSMSVFERLVGLSLYQGVNAHAKDYKLNSRIADEWMDRLSGLPHLRTLDLENTDLKGPGLRPVGALTSLESLNLTLCPVADEPLAALSGLTRLKVLGLASTKVTGTALQSLQGLQKLENLNLHNTPVTDAGLEGIGKRSSLLRLEIVHTQFTDAGTPALAGLVNLERLQLGSRKATGAALSFLRKLSKLRELDVHDGLLSVEGFQHVGAVPSLKVLRAYNGAGGDEGLKALAGLTELETLILENVGVTDAGLTTLAGLPKLKKLTLKEPKVTEAAVAKLRESRPGVDISR